MWEGITCEILFSMPIFLVIFLLIFSMWTFHLKCWSIYTPKNLVEFTWGIILSSMVRTEGVRGGCFLLDLNRIMFDLDKFRESLLALNQSLTAFSSIFAILKSWSYEELDRKTFVSSANRIKCSNEVELGRSLMNIINRRGPNMEPCGTPYLKVGVWTDSYCIVLVVGG